MTDQITTTAKTGAKAGNPTVNILLVDDRPENLLSLESILEQTGRKIFKASSGNEALKITLSEEIGLILLDVQMPEMDGFEVARLLKENSRTKDIAIIFVTAISKEEKFTIQGYEEGAVDYLHKPLEINIVKAKVAVFEKLYLQKADLQEYADKVERINKQLDEFVYIVSHDLKAPLRGLASLATFMEDELGENPKPEILDILHMMKSRTVRMQNLIDGILHYSRLGNTVMEKEKVDVKELINNIIDLISLPENIRVEISDNMPLLVTEKIKLHEVLQNLISNAVKYNDKEKGELKISCEDADDHYIFRISDNGIGIKPEHHEKIFGIFQTLQPKDKVESTGIGLTIVKKIIEQQNGTIFLESELGKGSIFGFTWRK
jgi:two-component system sensor histidine kinase/response regulator